MSKTNAINWGRDHYRAVQAICRQRLKRVKRPESLGTAGFQVKLGGRMVNRNFEVVELGGQKYRREHVKDKIYSVPHFMGPDGKPITIPYQTCTLVRVEVSSVESSDPDPTSSELQRQPKEDIPAG